MAEKGLPMSVVELSEKGAIDLVGSVRSSLIRQPGPISNQTAQLVRANLLIEDNGKEHRLFVRGDALLIDVPESGGSIKTVFWDEQVRYRVLGYQGEGDLKDFFMIVRVIPE